MMQPEFDMQKRYKIAFKLGFLLLATAFWVALHLLYVSYKDRKLSAFSSNCEFLAQEALGRFEKAYMGERVILIGDSRMAQWPINLLHQEDDEYTVYNFAVGGDVSREVLCRLKYVGQHLDSKIIILHVGINDLVAASMLGRTDNSERRSLERKVVENIGYISDLLSPRNTLLVTSIVPPIDMDIFRALVWGSGLNESALSISDKIEKLPGIRFVDLSEVFYDKEKSVWRSDLSLDALHWNQSGYAELTRYIYSNVLVDITKKQ